MLKKQCFAFHIITVNHVWNLISQPLFLVADTVYQLSRSRTFYLLLVKSLQYK